jgi:hypothetical protein
LENAQRSLGAKAILTNKKARTFDPLQYFLCNSQINLAQTDKNSGAEIQQNAAKGRKQLRYSQYITNTVLKKLNASLRTVII